MPIRQIKLTSLINESTYKMNEWNSDNDCKVDSWDNYWGRLNINLISFLKQHFNAKERRINESDEETNNNNLLQLIKESIIGSLT